MNNTLDEFLGAFRGEQGDRVPVAAGGFTQRADVIASAGLVDGGESGGPMGIEIGQHPGIGFLEDASEQLWVVFLLGLDQADYDFVPSLPLAGRESVKPAVDQSALEKAGGGCQPGC